MENQVNIGDQNTQQIEQNPVSQNIQIPEKPKVNYWMVATIILSISIVSFGSLYVVNNYRNQQKNIVTPPQTKENKTVSDATSTVKPVTNQSKFAFLRGGDIWVSDNNKQKKITDYKHNYSIVLSPDLSKIAYFSTPLDQVKFAESAVHVGGYGLTRNIWLINIDGNNPKKLTDNPGYFSELKFSPNGKYLAYINLPSNELLVIDLNMGNPILQQSIDGLWTKYRWGPKSDRLIIAAQTKTNSPSDLVGINIFEIDLGSKNLSKMGSVAPFGNSLDFLVSPDLKYLAYFGEKQNVISYGMSTFDWGYWITNLDGTNPKEILVKKSQAKDHGPNINFKWSPDGSYLAFFDEDHNENKTTLKIYEMSSGKLYIAIESESSFMDWDQNNNLYLKQFVPNVGVKNEVSKVDFKAGSIEKFLENVEELNFGNQ